LDSLEIDDQIELGWLLDRNFGGFYPAHNLVRQPGAAPEKVREICSIGHETGSFDQVPNTVHRRQSRTQRESVNGKSVAADNRTGGASFDDLVCKGG
jgi:hypothetical protein